MTWGLFQSDADTIILDGEKEHMRLWALMPQSRARTVFTMPATDL